MRALAIIGLILGLGAIGASVFAKVETYPNYKYTAEAVAAGDSGEKIRQIEMIGLADYVSTLKLMHMAAWGAGALALIMGAIAFAKQRVAGREQGTLPVLAIVAGLAGAGLSVLSAPPWV